MDEANQFDVGWKIRKTFSKTKAVTIKNKKMKQIAVLNHDLSLIFVYPTLNLH